MRAHPCTTLPSFCRLIPQPNFRSDDRGVVARGKLMQTLFDVCRDVTAAVAICGGIILLTTLVA